MDVKTFSLAPALGPKLAQALSLLIFFCLAPLSSLPVAAQTTEKPSDWPARPVTLIVPFAPGGPTDTVARLLAEQLRVLWQQPVIVDYKPGAGTVVGTQFVASAPADGYTLGMAITAHMINPTLQPKLPYDTMKDLMPYVKDNRRKAIALASPKRAAAHPEIPLIAERLPGFSAMSFIGVIAPSGLTKPAK
jgi:tripartite-type tricarboxylate transporter receptor subunit TctC